MLKKDVYDALKEELKDILAQPTIDSHIHCGTSVENIPKEKQKPHPLSYGIMKHRTLTPKKDVFQRIFTKQVDFVGFPLPLPFDDLDPHMWNSVLMIEQMKQGVHGLMHFSKLEQMQEAIDIAMKHSLEFKGIKFHPRMASWKPKKEVLLSDLLNKDVLDFAETNKLSLLLELSHGVCKEDTETLKGIDSSYKINTIIPHCAQNHKGFVMSHEDYKQSLICSAKEFEKELKPLSELNNTFMDASMVIDRRVVEAAITTLGEDKIMYGTDFPFGFTQKIREFRFTDEEIITDLRNIIDGDYGKIQNIWNYDYNILLQIKALKDSTEAYKKVMNLNTKKAYNL